VRREREGGGKTRQDRSWGLAPTRSDYPRHGSSAPNGGGSPRYEAARQGHPQALTPANLALEGPEVQIVTLGNNLLRGGIYCATLDHCTVLSAKLTERIVIT